MNKCLLADVISFLLRQRPRLPPRACPESLCWLASRRNISRPAESLLRRRVRLTPLDARFFRVSGSSGRGGDARAARRPVTSAEQRNTGFHNIHRNSPRRPRGARASVINTFLLCVTAPFTTPFPPWARLMRQTPLPRAWHPCPPPTGLLRRGRRLATFHRALWSLRSDDSCGRSPKPSARGLAVATSRARPGASGRAPRRRQPTLTARGEEECLVLCRRPTASAAKGSSTAILCRHRARRLDGGGASKGDA
jgi:hypothetical protein